MLVSTIIAPAKPSPTTVLPSFYPAVRVSSEKDEAPRFKPLARATRYRFWQPNDHCTTCCLVVDIDREDDWMLDAMGVLRQHPDLRPSWIIQKVGNHHGQMGWFVEPIATGPTARLRPQQYGRAVRQALTNAFGGDQGFTNARCWNPFWTGWKRQSQGDVYLGPLGPRPLGELHAALTAAGLWDP